MPTPLAQTFEALAKSRNDASTATLLAAIDAPDRAISDGAILALVRRSSKAGHLAALRRWHTLSAELKQAIKLNEGRMGGALHDALLGADEQLFANAAEVARETGEFDLAPTLITVAEQPVDQRSRVATKLISDMVERLAHAVASESNGGYSRHPETIRKSVLESLERSVERFVIHGRRDLIEAFVILAGPDCASLRLILEAPHHPCHQTVVDMLNTSTNGDVLKLLTDFLTGAEAPAAVRHVVARRTDAAFVSALLAMPLDGMNPALLKNLDRIKSFACLESPDAVCRRLAPAAQAAAMRLLSLSGAGDDATLTFSGALLARGSLPARVAACEALEPIPGQRSNELVLAALADPEAEVQAAATRQLRDRHIPGTMAKLIELASSPHPAVQDAARQSLAEFSFENFMARYETLDDEARRSTGALVALIDVNALSQLEREMSSLIRRHRLRAIEAADLMGVVPKLAHALVERLDDEDHMVRAAAAAALAECTSMDVRDALIHSLGDRSHAVQTAARDSLRTLGVEVGAASASTLPGGRTMTTPIALSLLAQVTREQFGRGFRGATSQLSWFDLVPYIVVVVLICAGTAVYSYVKHRNDMTERCDDPHKLFRELCLVHQLDRPSRRLLLQLADCLNLAQPAQVFLTPAAFEPVRVPAPLRGRIDELKQLRAKLF